MSNTNPVKEVPIPGPKGIPFLGNIYDLDPEAPINSINLLADTYGPIFRLKTLGSSRVVVSSYELVDEVCNEKRFTKAVVGPLKEIRNGTHDGLFTANYPGEENWAVAHRILVPAFGPLMIREMFDEMYDIASQLVMKWARQGHTVPITVTNDFTRLTLDTLALCAMGTRFNSFYHEDMHPFIEAMVGLLIGSGNRASRPAAINSLPTTANTHYHKDITYMRTLAQELVDTRRNNPQDKKDLMNALILGRDPQTGQGMTKESIVMKPLPVPSLFCFIICSKLLMPIKKVQEEVDRIIGRRKITIEDLSKLPYITAVLRETLRLSPPAPVIHVGAYENKDNHEPVTLGGGKYVLHENEPIALLLGKVHRDPKIYGADADDFRPERMLDEEFEKLPKNAWKPFGNGRRGCIGRPFAWQEILLVTAILFQNFNFQLENPSYDLRIKQTLTIKPKDLQMRASLREDLDPTKLGLVLNNDGGTTHGADIANLEKKPAVTRTNGSLKPLHIFYGSNTGTCEAFAHRLADDAIDYGFSAQIDSLDSAIQSLSTILDPIIFISSSYEGQPPDNAAHFFEWLSGLKGNSLEAVNYAVFGCGHRDWAATLYRIPKLIYELVSENGGNRLCEIGFADTASSDIFTEFDTWGEKLLWPSITEKFGGSHNQTPKSKSSLQVDITTSGTRASAPGIQLQEGFVLENKLLTKPGVPAKRLVRFGLPSDMTYQCGDYLAVLPMNPNQVVRRAMSRLDIPWDAILRIHNMKDSNSIASTTIPLDTPISAFKLLTTYVELSQPVSKRDLTILADAVLGDDEAQAKLRFLASSPSQFAELVEKRVSILDILMQYPAINLPIGDFLAMLPPMRIRQYSISSSPLFNPSECSITIAVLSAPALSGKNEPGTELIQQYHGVASNYLSELQVGEHAQISVRPSHSGFKPPLDLQTPMIMACAGTGLAPFRGFVMDRAERIRGRYSMLDTAALPEDERPAKAVLYIGCRAKGQDDIHADELAEWVAQGIVDVRWAYSRPENGNGQHVQDLMRKDFKNVVELFDQGAFIYVCGSTAVGREVRAACKEIYLNRRREKKTEAKGRGEVDSEPDENAAAEQFFEDLKTKERYATDVFA
ncbi:Oxidoreductase FAD/NAD(P)-binding [Penicillium taxi]|uniref:Oxidoreductase FAD/NAD(P)-binding n=1 Tax=Penicillium taxi TaxID=168475 RepID=UPI0025455CAA|nr:Oxidoreductase FAD/NAD(P)-binding [Penicillium taxi]KAJ5908057.1 Oxidoreductase FAD/NAD(P)-binding [Penicillium taxi]